MVLSVPSLRLTAQVATAAMLVLTACQPAPIAAPTTAPAAAAKPTEAPPKPAATTAPAPTTAPAATAAKPAAAAAPTAPVPTLAPAGKPATLVPFKWLFGFRIQANPSTAAIVIAKELGYYAEQGLDLTWDISNDQTSIRLIAAGQYQAGSLGGPGTLIDMVNENLPVKSFSIINQEGSRTFAVKADSGIKRPKDLEGKTVGYKVSYWPEYLAMMASDGADRSKVKEIEVGFSSVELANGTVDMLPVFKSNEPYTLKNTMGMNISFVDPKEFGYPTFGTALIGNSGYMKSNPDQMTGFLKATLRGLQYYLDNKEKALEIVQRNGPKEVAPELNAFIYSVEAPQVTAGVGSTIGIGAQTKEQWQREVDTLGDMKVTKGKPKVEDLYDNTFIERSLKDGKVVWP
jgi:ABC-type nitrate/sulfonate/bicarbonate transport system substrate-binding protein